MRSTCIVDCSKPKATVGSRHPSRTQDKAGARTEDVDIAEGWRYLGPQHSYLSPVRYIELYSHDQATLLYSRRLVRGPRGLCDYLELITSARKENQVCASLYIP